jgi:hypothetical protein
LRDRVQLDAVDKWMRGKKSRPGKHLVKVDELFQMTSLMRMAHVRLSRSTWSVARGAYRDDSLSSACRAKRTLT